MEKKTRKTKAKETEIAEARFNDKDYPTHGNLKTRGKVFEGKVIRKFPKRVTIEFERMVYAKKYERYEKNKTKIHARLLGCMVEQVQIGDLVRVMECRPLSKIIHFVVTNKIKEIEKK